MTPTDPLGPYLDALAAAGAFLDANYPGVATDHRFHVLHRLVEYGPFDDVVDQTVVQLSAYKAEGPDGNLARRFVYGLLGIWQVEVVERPTGHVHGLCWACTKAYRRSVGISSNNDLPRIPFYRPRADLDAMWARTEAELATLPKTRMVGA